jgi:hypothetical protein
MAAISRSDTPEDQRRDFYLYVDEFQNFATPDFATILSEARKYKLNLTIAHQYIEQMTEEVKSAVFGNVGSMVTFRVVAYDAEALEKEFAPIFTMEDIVNLDKFQIYLRLMIDGVGSQPFSAVTINTPPVPDPNFVSEIIDMSRSQFARPRAGVEDEIKDWHRPIEEVEKDKRNATKEGGPRNGYENGNGRNSSGNGNGQSNGYGGNGGNGGGQAPRPKFDNQNGNARGGDFKPRNPAPFPSPNPSLSYEKRNVARPTFEERKNNFPQREEGSHNPFKKALVHGTSEEKEKAHLERELELRKAISLNFLKKEEPKESVNGNGEEKKDKKGVTQESLSDLRSALQSVLTQANIGIGPETKILEKSQGGEARPAEKHIEPKSIEKKPEVVQQENPPEKKQQPEKTNHSNHGGQINEIPEKELRDILSIED